MENNNKDWERETTDKESKSSRNNGNNGNPAQSAARPTSREQDASPATPEKDPLEIYPDLMPDSRSRNGGEPKRDRWKLRE